MTKKTFYSLFAATGIALLLAVFVVARQPSFQSADVSGALVFPKLVNELNSLKTVVIRSKEGTFNLDFDGRNWMFRERGGYLADEKKVNELVFRLTRMQKLEAKTKLEDRYDRLDLQAPDAKDSRAKEMTLIAKDGNTLADIVVGKRKFTLGSKEGGTYIRIPEDPQTWLAMGELNPGDKARDWLKREITDIKDKQIKRVSVTHPGGEKVVVVKNKPDDASFKIQGIPPGKEPSSDFVADEFGRVLALLMLDDVAKADEVPMPPNKTIKAEFEGFDGFKIVLEYLESDGKNWIKVRGEASADIDITQAKTASAPPPSAAAAPDAKPENESKIDWVRYMAELNQRTDGWVFEVPAYEVSALKKKMADITKKAESKS